MTTIVDVIMAPALGAFYYDDQAAIRQGRGQDGLAYAGVPLTPGFAAVRVPAAALGVGLLLAEGQLAWGDMVSVQYSGAAGRDPLFDPVATQQLVRDCVAPRLIGRPADQARANAAAALAAHDGRRLPIAVEYGISQAALQAAALARRQTMAEVVADDLGLPPPRRPVPIFAQSGDERQINVDKMILKRADILPHGLINAREKFGPDGAAFLDYVRWVAGRVRALGPADYQPVLHFDLYGWIGLGIGLAPQAIADFCARMADAVPGWRLHLECPADYGSRDAQIAEYAAIVAAVDRLTDRVAIVADEYCNTLDDIIAFCAARAGHIVQIKTPDVGSIFDTATAIRHARACGIGAYSGGSCAETDVSARACVHVAVAAEADMMLAKPGMGVDEAITIVANEQARLLASIAARHPQ